MSVRYVAVTWNRQKRIYDLVLGLATPGLVALFWAASALAHPAITAETALIRGFGIAALVLLHVILCIGPLCRLDPSFLPLLYNRRHLGVTMCLTALAHAGFALFQYHALGDLNPVVSLLASNGTFGSIRGFPFELLGVLALAVLVLMAATSHDFWLSVLTPPVWKRLHMLVYAAYLLVVGHVALGLLQAETHPALASALGAGFVLVVGLHLVAARRERAGDRERSSAPDRWVEVCRVEEIPEKRARAVTVGGERVAVFRYDGKVSAVSNVCRHQNGPLGEGRIVDGCITCPWHGYQYLPESGTSPPPFADRIPTFNVRVEAGHIYVDSRPNPPGTSVAPARAPVGHEPDRAGFYIGYQPAAPAALAGRVRRRVVTVLLLASGAVLITALAQGPFVPAVFEFGRPREVTGRLVPGPYPTLLVEAGMPVRADGGGPGARYLLVAPGKRGADGIVARYPGRRVRITGTLAYRGNGSLLEVLAITALPDSEPTQGLRQDDLGTFTLSGEIVDAKCFLGVMTPGEGKTHLACAVRCLSGGLPPLFLLRDRRGAERHLFLTDTAGAPLGREVLRHAARPMTVIGRVVREGDLLFLRSDPATWRSVP